MHSEPFLAEVGTLYVVATPSGHLRDIGARALDVLRSADVIAAEDTRHTRHLLDHFGIDAKLVAVHEHNERASGERVVRWLAADHTMTNVPAARVTDVINPARTGPSGIGFDRRGRLYLTHWGPGVPLYRYDPMTMMLTNVAGVNQN